jgi:hypothetical protein
MPDREAGRIPSEQVRRRRRRRLASEDPASDRPVREPRSMALLTDGRVCCVVSEARRPGLSRPNVRVEGTKRASERTPASLRQDRSGLPTPGGWLRRGGGRRRGPGRLAHDGQQVVIVPRLLQIRLGPRLERAFLVAVKVAGGDDDDRNHGEVRVRSEPLQADEALTGGQTQIQNDEIRLILERFADRGQSIDGEGGIVVKIP